jgi:hypothetical protein
MKLGRKRSTQIAFLIGLMLACGTAVASAQVLLESISEHPSVVPPELLTLVLRATNTGGAADTYSVDAELPSHWTMVSPPTPTSIAPGNSEILLLLLRVPSDANAGEYSMAVRIVSQSDPATWAETPVTVSVRENVAVELLPLAGRANGLPGGTAEYRLWAINRGNVALDFKITAQLGSKAEIIPQTARLVSGERVEVLVQHTVPDDAIPGATVRLVLTLHAAGFPLAMDTVTLSTHVLPPAPDAVGGSLVQELPAHVRLSVGGSAFTGATDSSLAFSFAGEVGTGNLFAHVLASSIFGPRAVSLTSWSMLYRDAPATFAVGDTSRALTRLLSVSCRGGMVELDQDLYAVTFIAGGMNDETRVGGRGSLGLEQVNVGIAYVEERAETAQRASWSLLAGVEPLEGWTLDLEGALGKDGMKTDHALVFASQFDIVGYSLGAEAFSVGTNFPSARADTAGISLAQHLNTEDLSLQATFSHRRDNVIENPVEPTTANDDLKLSLSTMLLRDGPTLSADVGFSWERDATLTLTDTVERRLSATLTGGQGVFPFTLSAALSDQDNHVTGTFRRDLLLSEEVGLSLDDLDFYFTLTHKRAEDQLSGEVLSGGTGVSIRLDSRSALHSMRWALHSDPSTLDLSAWADVHLSESVHLQFESAARWDWELANVVSLRWGIAFDTRFSLPLAFLATKARAVGRLFVDANGNGTRDGGEQGLPNIILALGEVQARTDSEGRFRFPPMPPGEYVLHIANLPPDYVMATDGGTLVKLTAGGETPILIPLTASASVRGCMFVLPEAATGGPSIIGEGTEAKKTTLDSPTPLSGIRVSISNGVETYFQMTDSRGEFGFDRLRAGQWTVNVRTSQLPPFHYLEPSTFDLTLAQGERAECEIIVLERRRPVQLLEEEELNTDGQGGEK